MKIIYRISDSGYNKNKPYYVTKKNIFLHFLQIFNGYDIYIIADNISEDTYNYIKNYLPIEKIVRTNLSNAGSFLYSVYFAINNFNSDNIVYFAEDDYIYIKNAPKIIEEGLTISDYSSGYDHPDKYVNYSDGGPNPYISNGGEETCVMITNNRHWKLTNSCCMTFACKVKTIKEDLYIFEKYCKTNHPEDFHIFVELTKNKNRKLVSCIPSVSTHGETEWLAKFVDWEKEFYNSFQIK